MTDLQGAAAPPTPGSITNPGSGAIATSGGVAGGAGSAVAGPGGTAKVINIRVSSIDDLGAVAELVRDPVTPKRRPPSPPPRRPLHFFGRSDTVGALLDRVSAGSPTAVVGGDGVGKSTLIRHVATEPGAASIPDGVLLVEGGDAARHGADLVQELYDRIWDTGVSKRVLGAGIARAELAGINPLLLIDGPGLDADELQTVLDLFPMSPVLLATPIAPGGDLFLETTVGRLERSASVELLSQRCTSRQTVEPAILDRACELLLDWPGALATLGDFVRSGRTTLKAAVEVIEARMVASGGLAAGRFAGSDEPGPIAYERLRVVIEAGLDRDERAILETVASLPGPQVSPEIVVRAAGGSATPAAIEQLKATGLIWTNSPELRMDDGLRSAIRRGADPGAAYGRLLDSFVSLPTLAVEDVDVWTRVAGEAARRGLWSAVIDLARRLDPILISTGRWAAWSSLLSLAVEAAHASGDGEAIGWAYHELGTRQLALGEWDAAGGNLGRALAAREAIGGKAAIARTRQNLDLLARIAGRPGGDGSSDGGPRGDTWRRGPSRPPRPSGLLGTSVISLLLVVAIGTTALVGAYALVARSSPSPSGQTAPPVTQSPTPHSQLALTTAFDGGDVSPTGDWKGTVTVTVAGGSAPYRFEPGGSPTGDGRQQYDVGGTACQPAALTVTVNSGDAQSARIDQSFTPERCGGFRLPAPPELAAPADGTSLIFNCAGTIPVMLEWKPVQEGTASWIVETETASTEGASSSPSSETTDQPGLSIEAPCSGFVRWRVATTSADGWQGGFSDWSSFRVQPTSIPVLFDPVMSGSCVPSQELAWEANPDDGIAGYRLTITDTTTGKANAERVGESTIRIDVVCGHTYAWTVASIDARNEPGQDATQKTFALPEAATTATGTLAGSAPPGATTINVMVSSSCGFRTSDPDGRAGYPGQIVIQGVDVGAAIAVEPTDPGLETITLASSLPSAFLAGSVVSQEGVPSACPTVIPTASLPVVQ